MDRGLTTIGRMVARFAFVAGAIAVPLNVLVMNTIALSLTSDEAINVLKSHHWCYRDSAKKYRAEFLMMGGYQVDVFAQDALLGTAGGTWGLTSDNGNLILSETMGRGRHYYQKFEFLDNLRSFRITTIFPTKGLVETAVICDTQILPFDQLPKEN
jgi:hypothetical protein